MVKRLILAITIAALTSITIYSVFNWHQIERLNYRAIVGAQNLLSVTDAEEETSPVLSSNLDAEQEATPDPKRGPRDELAALARQRWSDGYVMFVEEPRVCDGLLSFVGSTQQDANLGSGMYSAFTLYQSADLKPKRVYAYDGGGLGVAPPVAPVLSIHEPIPGGRFYYPSSGRKVVAQSYVTRGLSHFEVTTSLPKRITNHPEGYVLGVWGSLRGHRNVYLLRLINLQRCDR